jgi:hypothetical protein
MRPLRWVLFLALVMAGSAAAEPPFKAFSQPSHCRDDGRLHRAGEGAPGHFHRLTELPPARAFYPMMERGADGCITPVLFGTRHGAPPRRTGRAAAIGTRTFP